MKTHEADQGGAPYARPRHAGLIARSARVTRRAIGDRG